MISNSDNEDYESADGDNYSGLPGLLPVPNSPRRILDRNEYPISEIINNIFISNFLDKKSGHAHIVDINIVEKWMFLRDIKYDDIGLICHIFDRCIIYFHGFGQSNYACEILYF